MRQEVSLVVFQFTDDCLLGVEEIDEEHKHLFDLLNESVEMLYNDYGNDKYTEIKELLEELENYADQHFSHEEAYMEQILDPELILQRPPHVFFREKILEFLMKNIDDDEGQHQILEDPIHFLARWLYRHIIGSDILIGKLPPLEEWMIRENPCEFTSEYLTGIDIIDREHRVLFEITGRANSLVRGWTEEKNFDEINQILDELKEYAKEHFTGEEEYMLSIGYDGYEAQRRAHEAFIDRLDNLEHEQHMDEDPKRYLHSLIEFLLGWLINHILHVDKKIPKQQ